jgi:MioC protein
MDNLDASVFQRGGNFLICTSTYGAGDVPDNAQALFNSLETERPKLDNVTYGVIALGDTTYKDTFCQGGKRFDKMLAELGARRAGEMLMHDASSGTLPEELAAQWVVPWVEQHLAPRPRTIIGDGINMATTVENRMDQDAKVLESYLGGKWQGGAGAGLRRW